MREVTDEGRVLEALGKAATPAAMVSVVSGVDDFDTLVVCWEDSGNDVIRAIIKRAIIAGKAHALAGHGDGISKKLADKFGVSERHMDRMIRTYREIIVPKLERDGANATFLLEERMFYDLACEAAPVLKIPAVELLEQAEEKRAHDPKFTPSRWKRELGLSGDPDEGSTGAPDKAIMRWLKKAAKFETGDGIEFAKNADREMLNVARDALTFAREILDELESRFAGRVEP